MNYLLLVLIVGLSGLPPTFAQESSTPPPPNIYAKDTRAQALADMKKKQDLDTQERLKKRSKGRKLQEIGGKVVAKTNDAGNLIYLIPQSLQQYHIGTALSILNKVVAAAGTGIRAYGRRQEALSSIVSANEQILEGAVKSSEKAEALSKNLEELIGPKTITKAYQENQSSDLSKGKKILNLFAPSNFINTFNNFTDDFYITDNKADRWESIKKVIKELKEEQLRFDDYMALLQIKFFEKLLMSLHLEENKSAYILKLEESATALTTGIKIKNQEIKYLRQNPPPKGGMMDRIKKTFGKDDQTKHTETLNQALAERQKYVTQRESMMNDIKYYQEVKVDSNAITSEREELKKKISEVQGRRAAKVEPEELFKEIQTLKEQVQSLNDALNTVKTSRPKIPQSALMQPGKSPLTEP